ncbi:MAG TPA: hypothetical protein VEQ61_04385 [Thermoleophilaceae bacterium]|nr:hypothetical protein [Thermoleophilaceae bacterium]
MHKLKLLVATVLALALTATGVAFAANVYDLPGASTSPKGKGSTSKPAPKKVSFNYTVKDEAGPRGEPVKTYKIAFQGIRSYGKYFPKCTYAQTNQATVSSKCKRAIVGSGRIEALLGPDASTDPNLIQSYCNLKLTLYNIGNGIGIRLDTPQGSPSSQDGPFGCLTAQHTSIRARDRVVNLGGVKSGSLEFDVPNTPFRHVAGFQITTARVTSTINRKTRTVRIKGKRRKVGYYSSVGCGKNGKRLVRVTFVDENNKSSVATKSVRC